MLSAIEPERVRSFEHNGRTHCGICGLALAGLGKGLAKHFNVCYRKEHLRCEGLGTLTGNNKLPETSYMACCRGPLVPDEESVVGAAEGAATTTGTPVVTRTPAPVSEAHNVPLREGLSWCTPEGDADFAARDAAFAARETRRSGPYVNAALRENVAAAGRSSTRGQGHASSLSAKKKAPAKGNAAGGQEHRFGSVAFDATHSSSYDASMRESNEGVLHDDGLAALVFVTVKKRVADPVSTKASVQTGASLEEILGKFVKGNKKPDIDLHSVYYKVSIVVRFGYLLAGVIRTYGSICRVTCVVRTVVCVRSLSSDV